MNDVKMLDFLKSLEKFLIVNDDISECLFLLSSLKDKMTNYDKDHTEKYLSHICDDYKKYSCIFNPFIEVFGKPRNIKIDNGNINIYFNISLKDLLLDLLVDTINKTISVDIFDDEGIKMKIEKNDDTIILIIYLHSQIL